MKNLLFLAVLFLGMSSCTRDMVELESLDQTIDETGYLSEELDSRSTWPMGAYDLVDFMNGLNFTNSNYVGCNDDVITLSFSGGNSTDVSDPYGPLSARSHQELYTISDLSNIVQNLWAKVRAECGGNAVIVDVEFRVGLFTPVGDYNYYIDAFPTVCCDPILEEVELPEPHVLHEREK